MSIAKNTALGIAAGTVLALSYTQGATTLDQLTDHPEPQAQQRSPSTSENTPTNPQPTSGPQAKLNQLTITPETSGDEYDRDEWGYGDDLNGQCNARALILTAESHGPVDTNDNCTVTSGGPWTEYYTGQSYTDTDDVQIEHVVPLEEAQRSGANNWDTDRKETFANGWNTNRLVIADADLNQDHSSDDPAAWMPPSNQCTYLVDWIDIKHAADLTVDQAEHNALTDGLATHC